MQTLTEYIKQVNEVLGQPIDDQWIDNEKPVMTKDKRQVIIIDRDMSKVPNILKGQVIGTIGKTGNVSEPQLYFSLRKGREAVDPLKYLPNI